WVEARIELHRRLALPLACIVLALVGIPLGASTRKGGKSAGYVNAVYLAFFTLIGLARQRTLPVEVAVWLPNAVFFTAGVAFLARLERPGDRDLLGAVRDRLDRLTGFVESRLLAAPRAPQQQASSFGRTPLLPQIVDTYVLSTFLFYLFLLLASFV